jgi:tripartite-type tricarboxylate transporter receptor subunit TctC
MIIWRKSLRVQRALMLALGLVVFSVPASGADNVADFPNRPVRMIVPSTPGGSVDTLARTVGARLSERWKQQVVVDNRAGAGGIIGAETVARALPDGYTLIMATIASMATNVSLKRELPYDPVKDFAPVTLVAAQQLVLLVHPGVAAKSVPDLIQLAKKKTAQLTFASAGSGTGGHLSGELFKLLAGIDMLHVPYKGVAPALVDVISGQVTMTFSSILSGTPHVKSNRLRALGVTATRRSPALPDVPTIAEAGVPGYESSTWYGVLGPKAMPRPVVMKLNRDIVAVLNVPELRERLQNEGAEPVGNTPEQFGDFIRTEIVKWAKVFKAAGIKPE